MVLDALEGTRSRSERILPLTKELLVWRVVLAVFRRGWKEDALEVATLKSCILLPLIHTLLPLTKKPLQMFESVVVNVRNCKNWDKSVVLLMMMGLTKEI